VVLLDPDIWNKVQGQIDAQLGYCCSELYDCGQEHVPYPAEEAQVYSRVIAEFVRQALEEQLRRLAERCQLPAGENDSGTA